MRVTPDDTSQPSRICRPSSVCIDEVSGGITKTLADLGESYSVRHLYDRGRMEIMAPDQLMKTPECHPQPHHRFER